MLTERDSSEVPVVLVYEEVIHLYRVDMTDWYMSTNCHNNLSSFPVAEHGATQHAVKMMNVMIFDCCDLSFRKGLSVTLLGVILRDYLICLSG